MYPESHMFTKPQNTANSTWQQGKKNKSYCYPKGGGGRWEIEAALMKSTKKIFCIMENTKAPSQISEII